MILIILVGSSSDLDLPKETPLEVLLIFFFLSPCLLGCWLCTLPFMIFLHLAYNCPLVNKIFSHYFNLSAICILSDAEIL